MTSSLDLSRTDALSPGGRASDQSRRKDPIPRSAVRAMVGFLVVLVALAGLAARLAPPDPAAGLAPATLSRPLTFVDEPDGSIQVTDGASGAVILVLPYAQDGFIRSTVRGLVRERKRRGIGAAIPFALSLHEDGRLILSDPETGRLVDLGAFGPTNAAAFARLLPTESGS